MREGGGGAVALLLLQPMLTAPVRAGLVVPQKTWMAGFFPTSSASTPARKMAMSRRPCVLMKALLLLVLLLLATFIVLLLLLTSEEGDGAHPIDKRAAAKRCAVAPSY